MWDSGGITLPFLILAVNRGDCWALCFDHFTPMERASPVGII
jgi:hypothetical protein